MRKDWFGIGIHIGIEKIKEKRIKRILHYLI